MNKKMILSLFLSIFLLSACSSIGQIVSGGCPDAEISWVDVLMINDIKYEGDDEGLSEGIIEVGKKIGEVSYMLADNACSNHRTKNGDAAFLPVGTEIYELNGYNPEFRVVADNRVFQVSENKKAKTISELLDIDEKVAKMSLHSDYDESHITDFTEQETTDFIEDLLLQDYVGYEKIYNKIKGDNRAFLRIYLKDGSSFRFVYWYEENAVSLGAFGTENMKGIVKGKLDN